VRAGWPLALAALAAVVLLAAPVSAAAAPTGATRSLHAADSRQPQAQPSADLARAPSSPPLSGGLRAEGNGEATAPSPQVEVDPLVSNGLGSPFCRGVLGEGALSPARVRDCRTSGFSAAGSPTGNWGIDVHIDAGLLDSSGILLSAVQNLFVKPLWMAVVWSLHALVVMLEWCFAIDLLDSPASGAVGTGLRQMQAAITDPWLAAVLAVAAVLALYNGLLRRRVADTVGQAVVMVGMMTAAMWLIADPQGTVGALGRLANQASLGTLGVSARGTTTRPAGALADSLAMLFASAIEAPWCYLEFGDVGWCRNPARLDPRLHAAALRIADAELAVIGCRTATAPLPCVPRGSAEAKTLEDSAGLLRAARSNGATFLALPADGPARNSLSEEGSLLHTICDGGEATRCRGPTAAQAQFRTKGGTWSRVGGLLLIVAGLLGMLLLFGFIAVRLLGAAIFSLLYLLLAPLVVLAPALGDAGRAVFRKWAAHLFAAVIAKLLFSFVLGVVLAVLAILASLEGLGWWTQWLLMSAFWWGAYSRRHQALAVAAGALGSEQRHRSEIRMPRMLGRVEVPHTVREAAQRAKRRLSPDRTSVEPREKDRPTPRWNGRPPGGGQPRPGTDEQARRMLECERRESIMPRPAERAARARLLAEQKRLTRLHGEHSRALVAGNTRRAAELAQRRHRVERQVTLGQQQLDASTQGSAGWRRSQGDGKASQEGARERGSFLDAQARLPGSSSRSAAGERRNYPELAPLIGLGRDRYLRLPGPEQRRARLEIDRELASRLQSRPVMGLAPSGAGSASPWRPSDASERETERRPPPRRRDAARGAGARPADTEESTVMRDAREVAARRKRQLGIGRP
jgi:hypothetical protein